MGPKERSAAEMKDFVNMTSDDNSRECSISTLVFMDLEATGLPSSVGRKNVHITEMSFIAIDRQSFEIDSSLRVLNKLSLCIRPCATVSPMAMAITGLYNDVLDKQEKFDDTIPKLLEYFFRRLKRPICLLAHNGNRYDFPLLQAELKNINYALDPQILCADTLLAIRFIVSNPIAQPSDPAPPVVNEPKTNGETPTDNHEKDNDPDVEILLTQDIDIFKNIEEPHDQNATSEYHTQKPAQLQSVILPFCNDEQTPPKPINFERNCISAIPCRKRKLDTTLLSKSLPKNETPTHFRPTHAKRQLFADGGNGSKSDSYIAPSKPVQFSLDKLYYHYFGKSPPTSHYAEADCMTLSQVCQRVNKEFLKWIDENSSPFCETKAMW